MDKPISELIEALSVLDEDLYVLEQGGEAKKLKWSTFIKFAVARLDGHGGIQSVTKTGTSGLADTHTITLADGTTYDIVTKNGRGISGLSKTSTSGLVDTYTITYNDGTTGTITVTNGEKGEPGDNVYTWIKYASQEPTESSHSMGDIPDEWRGEYNGPLASPPTDWKLYKWYKMKGAKGDTGDAAALVNKSVTYQVGDSGSIIPSGAWVSSVPVVSPGKYLWTKIELQFNTGDPIVSYSVSRMGIDGSGAVSTVCGVSPDDTGNVPLTAADVGALPSAGGDMTGPINMNGQPISGLNAPTENTQAANKGYVDDAKAEAKSYTDSKHITKTATITTTWSGSAAPYTQSVTVSGILASDLPHITPVYSTTNSTAIAQKTAWACVSKAVTAANTITFTCFEEKPTTAIPIQIEVNR